MRETSFRGTWLPLGIAVLMLVILNVGLYTGLNSQAVTVRFEIPYIEDFNNLDEMPYSIFGGDWEIRDKTLVQLSTSGYDLMSFVPVSIPVNQPYRFETSLRFLGGTMGGGLIFNAQQTTSRQKSHMARFNVEGGQLWLIYGYFGDDSNFVGQGSVPLNLAPDNRDFHTLSVQTDEDSYSLFLNNALVAQMIPLIYRGGSVGFISATSQVAFDNVQVDAALQVVEQITEATPPTAMEVVDAALPEDLNATSETPLFSDSFDVIGADGGSLWLPISGDWRYENSGYIQTQAEGFDLSSIYQQPITLPMTYQVTFQHRAGSGGGLLFSLPRPDSRNGGHMVRYIDAGDVMAWGYFDTEGVFVGQGSVSVPLPEQTRHTLEIRTVGQSYTIFLDETQIVADVPLVGSASPSYLGLTASQSVVVFDEINVFNVATAASVEPLPPPNINTETATGNWIVEGGVITQTQTENADYVAGTGLAGERFTVSVDILLPVDNPEAGAGILFHMEGRDDPSLSHMVRFGSGGKELFWGRYDADGVFKGDGGIPLELETGVTHNLLLVVLEDSFRIQVDGVTAVESIPIQGNSGWIGLVSFSGPVVFSNVNVQLGQ